MFSRIGVLFFFFCISFLIILVRLFYWQILKGYELSEEARRQYQSQTSIDAPRGEIMASDGSWLAASGEAWLVYAFLPDIVEPPQKISEKIAPLLVDESDNKDLLLAEIDRLHSLLTKSKVKWIALKSRVKPEVKKKIEEMGIKGIGFQLQESRIYPEASSAAHLLGFVGKDKEGSDKGYFGLEGYYDAVLASRPGFKAREKDALGVPILLKNAREVTAISGVNLKTNIDKFIQLDLDAKLAEGVKKYGATSGMAVVMNPKTGAIFAMSSFPSYDPREYWKFNDELFRNPIISTSFEPGSVFKVLVMASALDAGVVTPDTICDSCSKGVVVDGYLIETWNKVYYPNSTMTDVIVHSDNVGMVFVGKRLGSNKLYDYLQSFGIGKLTGIDLEGEINPSLRPKDSWSEIDLATATFGQGVAVTPIQLITAVSVIANKGKKVTPQVVDKLFDDGWEYDIKPVEGERVISEKAASQITAMMVEAAKSGEAKWTHIKGFKVAGKTGTAQVPIAGHYDEEKTVASFIGFAPYDDPKFIMLVTLVEPTTSPWASETAAPLWYSIASDLFEYFRIQPEN